MTDDTSSIDLDFERYALDAEAAQIAQWTLEGRPSAWIDKYVADTGYARRLAAYKAGRGNVDPGP